MREIKFRAWDKHSKVMCDVAMLSWNLRDLFQKNDSRYEVMQFTGLKKNGKQIYEGDILMYPDTESEYIDVGIGMVKVAEQPINMFWPVEFRDGEFGMDIKDGELAYGASEKMPTWLSLRTFFEDYIASKECEIIGNIYENPELLV